MSAFEPLELTWLPEADQLGTQPAHDCFAAVVSLMATWPDELRRQEEERERTERTTQAAYVEAAIECLRAAESLELADIDHCAYCGASGPESHEDDCRESFR